MRDKVLTPLVEGQAEAPPVESAKEHPETMNATTEVNAQPLKLIKYLHQQVATLATNSNRTNPPNPTNTRQPSNVLNPWNLRLRNTRKYFWSHESCSHTSMDCNMKNTGHKYAANFCGKIEGSENYCRTTSE